MNNDKYDLLFPYCILQESLIPLLKQYTKFNSHNNEILNKIHASFASLQKDSNEKDNLDNLLSKREIEILEYMSLGMSNSDIADHLHRSVGTIKLHAHRIYKKLDVKNRVEAVNLYNQQYKKNES